LLNDNYFDYVIEMQLIKNIKNIGIYRCFQQKNGAAIKKISLLHSKKSFAVIN